MTIHPPTSAVSQRHRKLLLTATAMTALLITMGGVVCVTESGRGCPGWPRCDGQLVPPLRIDAIIEYTHRLIAALTSPFIIAAAVWGWGKARSIPWVSRPPAIAVALLMEVIVLGAIAVLRGLPPWAAALDLGSALMVLALMVTASVVAFSARSHPDPAVRPSFGSGFTRLTGWAAAAVFGVLVSGVLVAENGSTVRCLGCFVGESRSGPALQLGRAMLAGMAAVLVLAVVVEAWRKHRTAATLQRTATAAGILLSTHVAIAALMGARGATKLLLSTSVATAVALWTALVALVVLGGLAASAEERG